MSVRTIHSKSNRVLRNLIKLLIIKEVITIQEAKALKKIDKAITLIPLEVPEPEEINP